jgi:hypothetical protein
MKKQDKSTVTFLLPNLEAALLADLAALTANVPVWLSGEQQAHGPKRKEPVRGPGLQARAARIEAARAALGLVAALIREDAADVTHLIGVLQQKLTAARALGNGWIEQRLVWRSTSSVEENEDRTKHLVEGRRPFGPYLYYRWKEGGRTRSCYLGKPEEAQKNLWKLDALGVDVAALR